MENKSHALAAGIFVLAVAAMLAGLAIWLTRDNTSYQHYELTSKDGVTGLQPQAAVRYKGVAVGKVTRIGFDPQIPGNVLIRIAVNTCRDYRRSAWQRWVDRRIRPEELPETAQAAPEDQTDVLSEVMRLPLPLRQVIVMAYYQDMDADAASRALGISRASFYRRLKKARETLKLHAERWVSDD